MELLKIRLDDADVRGVVQSGGGEVREFHRKGVIDLFELITNHPHFLRGGKIADRVIGKGAALLLVKAGVAQVFAYVISQSALDTLTAHHITVSYHTLQPYIINRTGDGICPVERLTQQTTSPEVAYQQIKTFLENI